LYEDGKVINNCYNYISFNSKTSKNQKTLIILFDENMMVKKKPIITGYEINVENIIYNPMLNTSPKYRKKKFKYIIGLKHRRRLYRDKR